MLSLEIGVTTDCGPSASRKRAGSGTGVKLQSSHIRHPKARLQKAVSAFSLFLKAVSITSETSQ